jgi:hypothetical protein
VQPISEWASIGDTPRERKTLHHTKSPLSTMFCACNRVTFRPSAVSQPEMTQSGWFLSPLLPLNEAVTHALEPSESVSHRPRNAVRYVMFRMLDISVFEQWICLIPLRVIRHRQGEKTHHTTCFDQGPFQGRKVAKSSLLAKKSDPNGLSILSKGSLRRVLRPKGVIHGRAFENLRGSTKKSWRSDLFCPILTIVISLFFQYAKKIYMDRFLALRTTRVP